jgi:hypothetical protein
MMIAKNISWFNVVLIIYIKNKIEPFQTLLNLV